MAPKIAAGWARPPSLTLSRACRHTPRVVTVQPRDRGSSRHGRATGGIEIRRRSWSGTSPAERSWPMTFSSSDR